MTKKAGGETLQKGQKKRQASTNKCQETDKKAGKSAATQSENTEIYAKKALKIRKMPPTKCSKMLQKYKFKIYYRIY